MEQSLVTLPQEKNDLVDRYNHLTLLHSKLEIKIDHSFENLEKFEQFYNTIIDNIVDSNFKEFCNKIIKNNFQNIEESIKYYNEYKDFFIFWKYCFEKFPFIENNEKETSNSIRNQDRLNIRDAMEKKIITHNTMLKFFSDTEQNYKKMEDISDSLANNKHMKKIIKNKYTKNKNLKDKPKCYNFNTEFYNSFIIYMNYLKSHINSGRGMKLMKIYDNDKKDMIKDYFIYLIYNNTNSQLLEENCIDNKKHILLHYYEVSKKIEGQQNKNNKEYLLMSYDLIDYFNKVKLEYLKEIKNYNHFYHLLNLENKEINLILCFMKKQGNSMEFVKNLNEENTKNLNEENTKNLNKENANKENANKENTKNLNKKNKNKKNTKNLNKENAKFSHLNTKNTNKNPKTRRLTKKFKREFQNRFKKHLTIKLEKYARNINNNNPEENKSENIKNNNNYEENKSKNIKNNNNSNIIRILIFGIIIFFLKMIFANIQHIK